MARRRHGSHDKSRKRTADSRARAGLDRKLRKLAPAFERLFRRIRRSGVTKRSGCESVEVDREGYRYILTRVPVARSGELTKREAEVARLVAEGLRNTEVATFLEISGATVAVHLRKIYAKLFVRSRVELLRCLLATAGLRYP